MSTEKSPQIRTRAPKQIQPRTRVAVYLTDSDIAELNELSKQTNRSRSSLVLEYYKSGKSKEITA